MICTIISLIYINIIKHVITVTSICMCCVAFVFPSLPLIFKFCKSCYFFYFFFYFFYKCFDQMWLNEEARIAQVANINQLPVTNGFTSPPKDVVMNTSSFLRVELSTLIGEKSLTLVGLEPATFRLQASTLTSRPLVPPC